MIMETQHIKVCGMQLKLLTRKFITLSAYIRKLEWFKSLIKFFYLKNFSYNLAEQTKPKVKRRK